MNMWSWMNPPVIAGGFVLILVLLIMILLQVRRELTKQGDGLRQQNRALDKELAKANKQLLEVRSVVVGLGQRVSEQQDIISHLNERIMALENEDNDARLYSRATKMVKLGADVDELISECELPKAEAELMMSLQNKLAGREAVPPLTSNPDGQHDDSPTRRPIRRKP
ncbi:DUF2802 domain-containing protein [Vibrio porteresiae]|uniref:DUF2802 domain-containing protein n=1 Tax=Vibrio porteresiae DSM 19223 TaxID=1123496 RepID=A0ABZ0QET8_9VIBR|nr:DUF2802 domain-containing protein [Vibrio porteresiae]WPC74914.1 DUF2802 domain-containing protein [Vibrio porteresiae DSM 19223]